MKHKFLGRSVLMIICLMAGMLATANLASGATYDASGDWIFSTSNNWADPGTDCEVDESPVGTLTIMQDGDKVTMAVQEDDGDLPFTGKVTDAHYELNSMWQDEGVTYTATVNVTLSSETAGAGEVTVTRDDGVETCNAGFDISLTKVGTPATHDATGKWNYTTSDNWVLDEFACSPDDPETGTLTITQNGEAVTLRVKDDAGDMVLAGTVSGTFYYLEAIEVAGDETTSIAVIFELSSESAGAGQIMHTSSTGDEVTCIGGAVLVISKQTADGTDGPSSSSNCFIATAAYGSYLEPHVKVLREFRDSYIISSRLGASFVAAYYKYSPPIAKYIAEHESLRRIVKLGLAPVVGFSWLALHYGLLPAVLVFFYVLLALLGLTGLCLSHRRQ